MPPLLVPRQLANEEPETDCITADTIECCAQLRFSYVKLNEGLQRNIAGMFSADEPAQEQRYSENV